MAAQGVVMVENDTQKRTRPILILASNLKSANEQIHLQRCLKY